MRGRFAIVKEELWTDRKFLALSSEARLLFIWSWCPPHAAVCGLYSVSPRQLQKALGEGMHDLTIEAAVKIALDELEEAGLLRYDWDNEVVWVVNRVKHAATTPRARSLMQRELRACPDSPLVDAFVKRYGRTLGVEAS